MSEKKLLFSLTKKDFEVQTFCTGGKGGQHRNAKQNGVRIIHTTSGARAEHRDGRDQAKNKKAAFEKLVETSVFKRWHKAEVARKLCQDIITLEEELAAKVDEMMQLENLQIENYDPDQGLSKLCTRCKHQLKDHDQHGCNERVCDAAGSMDWCPCSGENYDSGQGWYKGRTDRT